jgi:hypothetical protein
MIKTAFDANGIKIAFPTAYLAPDIVAAILDETLPPEVTLFELAAGTPVVWEDQWGKVAQRSPTPG